MKPITIDRCRRTASGHLVESDYKAHMTYVTLLSEQRIALTVEVSPRVMIDLDDRGRVVGIEVYDDDVAVADLLDVVAVLRHHIDGDVRGVS